jgi:glycosyltransferase involved in cell wall biosynthesis
MLRQQSAIVAISQEIGHELEELGIPPDRILRIPNGVDTVRFEPAEPDRRAAARRMLGVAPEARVAAFVGVLDGRKNVGWLLDEWRQWRASGPCPQALLLLAGPAGGDANDPLRARVEAVAADPGSGVRWVGTVNRVEDVYAAVDLVILPSVAEGMPNVLLEAMASGLPIAAVDTSGSREIVEAEPPVGWLVRAGDAAALRRCFAALTRPEELHAMGLAARVRATQRYAMSVISERYEEAYSRLAGGAERSR